MLWARLKCGSRKFCQRGSKFDSVTFLDDEGIEDPNSTFNGSLSGHGGTMMAQL